MALIIKWNRKAVKHFDEAIEYIRLSSPANAEKVKWEILSTIEGLREHPQQYNPDKYKTNNDGSFRAFEMYHYRISYRHKGNEIRIIRVRHTKMNPLTY